MLIGRKEEQRKLREAFESEYSEFVVVYGRRRVGKGAQIDLLIDRNDGVINLCEMKYTKSPFVIDAAYDAVLHNKKMRFVETTETQKAVHLTVISSQGLVRNEYSDEIQCQVTGNDLFITRWRN